MPRAAGPVRPRIQPSPLHSGRSLRNVAASASHSAPVGRSVVPVQRLGVGPENYGRYGALRCALPPVAGVAARLFWRVTRGSSRAARPCAACAAPGGFGVASLRSVSLGQRPPRSSQHSGRSGPLRAPLRWPLRRPPSASSACGPFAWSCPLLGVWGFLWLGFLSSLVSLLSGPRLSSSVAALALGWSGSRLAALGSCSGSRRSARLRRALGSGRLGSAVGRFSRLVSSAVAGRCGFRLPRLPLGLSRSRARFARRPGLPAGPFFLSAER